MRTVSPPLSGVGPLSALYAVKAAHLENQVGRYFCTTEENGLRQRRCFLVRKVVRKGDERLKCVNVRDAL